MTFKKKILSAAIAGALLGSPAAFGITVHGITFGAGSVFEFALLAEGEAFGDGIGNDNGIIDAPGELLSGVGKIIEITDGIGNVTWSDGDNGRELTIYFHSYLAENFAFPTVGSAVIGFTGGIVEIYSELNPTAATEFERNGTQADDIARATGGDLFLSLSGSAIGDVASPEVGGISGLALTLQSNGGFTAGTVLGEGNLDVTGGGAGVYLDTNTFTCTSAGLPGPLFPCPDPADKVFTSSGQLVATPALGGWGFIGTADISDNAVEIPEPTTLALLGMGLMGLGLGIRRKIKV